jgi:hypothetical protein
MHWDAIITFQTVGRLDRSALKDCFFLLGFESIMRHLGFASSGKFQRRVMVTVAIDTSGENK